MDHRTSGTGIEARDFRNVLIGQHVLGALAALAIVFYAQLNFGLKLHGEAASLVALYGGFAFEAPVPRLEVRSLTAAALLDPLHRNSSLIARGKGGT